MAGNQADVGARAALADLCARGIDWRLPPERYLRHPERARRAAVLVLFGPRRRGAADADAAGPEDVDVLLLHRAATLREHAGQIAFPGGRVEPDDADAVDAALREAVEETGLDRRLVEVLGSLPDLPLPVTDHLVTPVVGWWPVPRALAPVDSGETSAVFRWPVTAFLDPENRFAVERFGDRRFTRLPAFRIEGRIVWGFTAIALDGLFEALGWSRAWDRSRLIEPTA